MKKVYIVLACLLALDIASRFITPVHAQTATPSWSGMETQQLSSSCTTHNSDSVVCVATDGVSFSYQGAAFVKVTSPSVSPVNTPANTSQWLNGYNASSGTFGQTQPKYSDLASPPTKITCPVASLSSGSTGTFNASGCTIQ